MAMCGVCRTFGANYICFHHWDHLVAIVCLSSFPIYVAMLPQISKGIVSSGLRSAFVSSVHIVCGADNER